MQERPNILIVITHDTGRHLGCYGGGVETPNIDRFAEQGVKFTNAFCTAPQCSPSRGSLITGKMPHTNGLIGLTHRGFRLNPGLKTLPALLAQAGYSTHLFGFQHEAPDAHSLGYQHVSEKKGGFSCKSVAPLAIDFLASAPKEPFFAMVGFSETHRKFPEVDEAPDGIAVPPYLPDHPDVRRDVAGLNILVRRVDDAFGAIADKLDETGLSQKTLVILTTDHGIAFPGAKATLFDPGVEIMFLARGEGYFSGGKVIDGLVSNMDITPTLLEIAGVTVPDEVEGKSLLPFVSGTSDEIRDELFLELTFHAAFDPIRAVRTRCFKYIRNFADVQNYITEDDTVFNCAGIVKGRQDVAESSFAMVNTYAPRALALHTSRLLHVSTDCVFDGRITEGAYTEASPTCPADAYGRSKLNGEVTIPPHLTVRVSFVGLGGRGLLRWLLDHPQGAIVQGYVNWFWNGWTVGAVAAQLISLALEPRITGLLHLPGPEVLTKSALLGMVANRLRPDLRVHQAFAPSASWMVLGSTVLGINAPGTTWDKMLDELEEEYKTWST